MHDYVAPLLVYNKKKKARNPLAVDFGFPFGFTIDRPL